MILQGYRVDAFTRAGAGGNPAGVVLDAAGLEPERMQAIAATLGYSETAFLTYERERALTVRFFAPGKEVAVCGHATVALFSMLHKLRGSEGEFAMLCGVGELRVRVDPQHGIFLSQRAPEVGQPIAAGEIASVLGLSGSDLVSDSSAHRVASTGLKKIFTEVQSRAVLDGLEPNRAALTALSEAHDAIGVYVYTSAESHELADWYCRNYAPVVGIWDDAATGTSAAALSGVLADRGLKKDKNESWVFFQGDPIGVPSRIDTQWQDDELWIGGQASVVEQFTL